MDWLRTVSPRGLRSSRRKAETEKTKARDGSIILPYGQLCFLTDTDPVAAGERERTSKWLLSSGRGRWLRTPKKN